MKMGIEIMRNTYSRLIQVLMLCIVGQFFWVAQVHAAATLNDITFTSLAGDEVEVTLHLSGDIPEPGSFTIDNPARIALDLPGTSSTLQTKNIDVGVGPARSINAIEAGGRTRVVINLARLTPYNIRKSGDNIIVTVGSAGPSTTAAKNNSNKLIPQPDAQNSVQDVQFRRGENGEGRVVVVVSNPNTVMDMMRRGDQVIVTLQDTQIPEKLERRLDVMDFGTPVRTVDAFKHGNDVRLVVSAVGEFEHLGYQADNKITLDVKKFVKAKDEIKKKKKKEYTGERLSLNFQNIEVRAVLQLIADFTGVNMVTSDSVQGNVTLRLKNVPWDQALDIILKTKGLDKRQKGNVMLVAPTAELAAQEKLELEAQKQVIELAPIISETVQVNYAKAEEVVKILEKKGNSLISERGNVATDPRTNKILIQDTAANIDAIVALIEELDVPVRQVLIESRVVLVTTNYSKELGVRFGVSTERSSGSTSAAVTGSGESSDGYAVGGFTPSYPSRLNVDLPVQNAAGSIGLAIAKLPFGTLIDLELSAAEAEGQTEIISSPKVITSNQHKAKILTGTEIPYVQESTDTGGIVQRTVSFKQAVLKLEVTPQITPDDRIGLDLNVTKDSPDYANEIFTVGGPPISKNEVETRVLVDNGETIVLGGVYERTKSDTVTRVPLLG
ncbi:MAG: type IV pilus secretin PilQ, partial [Thioalkalispiraceae bacterium]